MLCDMDNQITIFENEMLGTVRTLYQNGEPWFVGKDVADMLGYKETAKAIREHVDEDDKGVSVLDTPGGKQEAVIINEAGVYSLIFSSKLPAAKAFKRWVTVEKVKKNSSGNHPGVFLWYSGVFT